jgi:hypothetical protein
VGISTVIDGARGAVAGTMDLGGPGAAGICRADDKGQIYRNLKDNRIRTTSTGTWPPQPNVETLLEISCSDGNRQTIAIDQTWRPNDGPSRYRYGLHWRAICGASAGRKGSLRERVRQICPVVARWMDETSDLSYSLSSFVPQPSNPGP